MKYTSEKIQKIITSEAAKRALDYISPIYADATIALMILNCIGAANDDVRAAADEIWLQFHPTTATWGLIYWELEYGLAVRTDLPYEQRRAKVINKMRTRGPVNPASIKNLVQSVTGYSAEVTENVAKNTFLITISALPSNVDETAVRRAVDKKEKAHLIYEIDYEQYTQGITYCGIAMQSYRTINIRQVN